MSAATEKMRAEGLPEIAIETFAHYEQLLREGDQGVIRESEIEPLTELPDAGDLPPADDAVLDQVVVLKLNGGLGTSMGMTRAKSLIEACGDRCRARDVAELDWQTAHDNLRAQKVYERVGAKRDERWLDYSLRVSPGETSPDS